MRPKRIWTTAEDEEIRQRIAAGASTIELGKRFGVGRQCLLEHAKAIGAKQPRPIGKKFTPRPFNSRSETHTVVAYPREIWPLPPGHPESWGPIVRGTCLEGEPYG